MGFIRKLASQLESIPVIAGLLLLTKLLGFFKFRIIAGLFGAGRELDIFWAAFIIPDTLFNIMVAGSINAAVIPVFSEVLQKKGAEKLVKLFSGLVVFMGFVSIGFGLLVFAFSFHISEFLVNSGFLGGLAETATELSQNDVQQLADLMRIMMISPVLLGVSAIITAFLQVQRKFFITTVAPLVYNLGMIVGAMLLVDKYGWGVNGLAWAVVIGSAAHLLVQIPIVYKYIHEGLHIDSLREINGQFSYYVSEIWKIIRLAVPRVMAFVVEQFNSVLNTIISFSLTAGALSAYRFAFSLHLLPVQVIVGAIAQVALPDFSELYAKGKTEELRVNFLSVLRKTLYLIAPAVVILLVLRLPIVRLVYGTGEFDWWDTVVTSWCLALFSGAIIGQAVVALSLRAQYAMQETKLPLIATFVTVVVNIIGSYYLVNFFSHYQDWRPLMDEIWTQLTSGAAASGSSGVVDVMGTFVHDLKSWFTTRDVYDSAVGGLALSLSIAFLVEAALNMIFLNRKIKVITWDGLIRPTLKMAISSAVMALAMYIVFRFSDFSLDTSKTIYVATVLLITTSVGLVVYFVTSRLLKTTASDAYWNLMKTAFSNLRLKFKGK